MKYVTEIKSCEQCHHYDHSGAFTPGGAQPVCGHDKTVSKRGTDWAKRVIPHTRTILTNPEGWERHGRVELKGIPRWCPLRASEVK